MNHDSRVVEIEISKIVPNRFQPRKVFNDDVSELAESIRVHGVLQPITVRPLGEKYEIIMGERRYRACEKLGMQKIPCMIVEMNDRESMEVALIENLQRQDLSPIEEALSYKRILDDGYVTQDQLAQRLGKSQSTIANKLRLLSLDKEVQSALLNNKISERHARTLLRLENKDLQKMLLKKIIDERLTVKRTEEEVKEMEKDDYQTASNSDTIEIIDFDDNPFKTPIAPTRDSIVDDLIDRKPQEVNKEENLFDFDVKIENTTMKKPGTAKPKNVIPSQGIIDDLESGDARPKIESNHSFNSVFETAEDNSLENIVPDEIQFEQQSQQTVEAFDEAITKVSSANNFEQIKEIIEKCQNEIKALGYNVEFEKFDFEKMYQIIFKIEKK